MLSTPLAQSIKLPSLSSARSMSCRLYAFFADNAQAYNGSYNKTSKMVTIIVLFNRKTSIVLSHVLRKIPSTPLTPNAATMSRVKRNGTVSGVGRHLDCSNAIPGYKQDITHFTSRIYYTLSTYQNRCESVRQFFHQLEYC